MTNSNLDKFNEMTGKILAALYEKFPATVNLAVEDFVDGIPVTRDSRGLHLYKFNGDAKIFIGLVNWLGAEGYLRYSGSSMDTFFEATLTSKSLSILDAAPESLKVNVPLGMRLSTAAKSGATETLKSVAREVFVAGARMLVEKVGINTSFLDR
jgi:hypothetical protein